MTENNQELIDIAKKLLEKKYAPPVHSVAAALRLKDGTVVTGTNIDHFSGYVCAEASALDQAVNNGFYDFETIVAVRMNAGEFIEVANMCGKCRQIFHDYAPGINIIVSDGTNVMVKTIDEILPFSFKRQQEKIHAIIEGIKSK